MRDTSQSIARVSCQMAKDCTELVTHIGSDGYVYCEKHAVVRRRSGHEQCRRMRPWECALIEAGKPLPSYKLGPKPKAALPWDDCKVAFAINDDDAAFQCCTEAALPTGWELCETDGAGARLVAIFRVDGIPTVADAERALGVLRAGGAM